MKPSKDATAVVDLVDVLLADGAVLAADVVISVAEIPLVGVQARVLLAGMTRLSEEGIFEDWDREIRDRARREPDGVEGSE